MFQTASSKRFFDFVLYIHTIGRCGLKVTFMPHPVQLGCMGLNGVSPVQKDGRIRLPQEIREKYVGDYFAIVESDIGVLRFERVEVED